MNVQIIIVFVLFITSIFFPLSASAATQTQKAPVMIEKTSTDAASGVESTMTTDKTVEYALPYPGILPDHPLYFLKKFRDQIMESLIVDPTRKIEFFMLQADKGINTGAFLAAKQKEALALDALQRGRKYFERAIDAATSLKAEGKEIPGYILERFTNAPLKYKEVVGDITSKASDAQKDDLMSISESFAQLQEKVGKLK